MQLIRNKKGSGKILTSLGMKIKSPFDIQGIKTKATTQNILDAFNLEKTFKHSRME
ncbi:MAG: hypothetical protein QM504_05715 [Pseudomonadota bacterium]